MAIVAKFMLNFAQCTNYLAHKQYRKKQESSCDNEHKMARFYIIPTHGRVKNKKFCVCDCHVEKITKIWRLF